MRWLINYQLSVFGSGLLQTVTAEDSMLGLFFRREDFRVRLLSFLSRRENKLNRNWKPLVRRFYTRRVSTGFCQNNFEWVIIVIRKVSWTAELACDVNIREICLEIIFLEDKELFFLVCSRPTSFNFVSRTVDKEAEDNSAWFMARW